MAHGHWCLTVDVDEFLIYPFCETRPLRALTDWLDASQIRTFAAMLLDMYPKGADARSALPRRPEPVRDCPVVRQRQLRHHPQPALSATCGFRAARARALFFADEPEERAPALNKIPLVKWDRDYAYVSLHPHAAAARR